MPPAKPQGYALITGASSGIGVDFARQLAARGHDLILTARRQENLQKLADELSAAYQVCTEIIAVDLAEAEGADKLHRLVTEAGWQVSILVNNAGLGFETDFLDDYAHVEKTLAVNLQAATRLAWLTARAMRARQDGMILNVCSYSAFQPPTEFAVYAATKAYLYTLSTAATVSLRKDNVSMTALCPGFFHSEFFEKSGVNPSRLTQMFTLSSAHVARAGLAGMFRRKQLVVPGFYYKFSLFMLRFMPRVAATRFANLIMKH
jgi:short-subunit dehydrogenase